MKGSFDNGTTWYQFKWNNVEFKDFEAISKDCNSISELNSKVLETFPKCHLEYKYLGELKSKKK